MADQPQDDKAQSRYQLVKEILNEAQGDAHPSYQGHGKFWELPLEEFLQVTIYGVRMIATAGEEDVCRDAMVGSGPGGSCCESTPEIEKESSSRSSGPPASATSEGSAEHSCCGPPEAAAPGALEPSRGRGAASGLIKGLKGQFPFDGTQFPRLPWGGKQVSSSDILSLKVGLMMAVQRRTKKRPSRLASPLRWRWPRASRSIQSLRSQSMSFALRPGGQKPERISNV